MLPEFFRNLWHFGENVLSVAVAIVAFVVLRLLLRRFGLKVSPDVFGFVWDIWEYRSSQSRCHPSVNVEYRDASGELMNTEPFVQAELRNGHGGPYQLRDGVFEGCDPKIIKAGTIVDISVQDGLFRERLPVRIDHEKRALFARSRLTRSQLFEHINDPGRAN